MLNNNNVQKNDMASKDNLINEAVAIGVVLLSILMLLSLISNSESGNLIGRIGVYIYHGLTFVVGKYMAYIIPLVVMATGIIVWRGEGIVRGGLRVIGLYGVLASVCALLALPYSSVDFNQTPDPFFVSGAIGTFFVHASCLNLVGLIGKAGSAMLFTCLFIVSLSVLTNVRIRDGVALLYTGITTFDYKGKLDRLAGLISEKRSHYLETDTAVAEKSFSEAEPAPVSGATGGLRRSGLSGIPLHSPVHSARQPVNHYADSFTTELEDDEDDQYKVSEPFHEPAPVPRSKTPTPINPFKVAFQPTDEEDLFGSAEDDIHEEIPAHPFTRAGMDSRISSTPHSATVKPAFEPLNEEFYHTPSTEILNPSPKSVHAMTAEEMADISERLEKTLAEFNISAQVVNITQGPTVTRYEIQPAAGVKVAKIASLENDIAMCMKAESVRIIAPIPGKGTVGLEIPNKKATPIFLREMLETEAFKNHPSPLAFALGMTISGEPYICDLAAMPHVLIAGRTGSGKSVCLNSIITSILFRMSPEKVRMLMVDPKRVELNVYQAIPHLLAPVVCEPRKAAAALSWAVEQMEDRYKQLAALSVRNIDGYNAIVTSKKPHPKAMGRNLEYMPHIVIIIDELADLMLIAKNEVEDNIIRLAQMSRAVGMHLILATQRPSVNVITGIIKANFPCRVAFQVSSKVDSRTILDTMGAEALLGRGDMLFSPGGSPKPIRLQGCYVSDQEVENTADWVRSQAAANYLISDFLTQKEIEEQRMRGGHDLGGSRGPAPRPAAASGGLRLDGIDADDFGVPMDDDIGSEDDYTYQQERRDGRSVSDIMNGSAFNPPLYVAPRSSDDPDMIDEELFVQAARLILTHRKASVSLLQRKLKIGFARAGRVMDMLEERGIVGPNVGSKVREILVDPDEYLSQDQDSHGF